MFPHTRIIGPSLYYHRRVGGKLVQERIGRLDEGELVLRARYLRLLSPTPRTVGDLMAAWILEPHNIQQRTRDEYERQIARQLEPVFGRIPIHALKPSEVGQYLEKRGNVSANREVACLSSIFEWGIRKGFVEFNPARGIRRNRETPRHRYITHAELGQALRQTTPEFRDFMLAAYFTGFRQSDLREMQWHQVTKKGITLTETKTGKKVAMGLSAPLSAVLARCKVRNSEGHVFTNHLGGRWSLWAVQSAMRRLDVEWTFHDLRAKAESDHKSGLGLLARYKRAKRLEPTR